MTYEPNMSLALPSGAGWTQVSGGASIDGRTITAVGAANNFNYALGAPVMAGKVYFETYVQTNVNLAWVGVATAVGSVNAFGLSTATTDQRVCVAVDATAKRVWTRINGGAWTSGDPATGAGGFDYSAWGTIYPAAQVGPGSAVVYAADQPMFTIPSGFTNLTQTQQYVSGVVKVQGTPQAGLTVRAYDAYTGVLLGATTTGTDGSYNIACGGSTMVFVTSHDLTMFDALIHDGVMTVGAPGSATPTGQMFVFNFLTGAWVVTSGFALPAGGAAGQVLTKNTTTDGDAAWVTPTGGSGLPSGGVSGQMLLKMSATSGDAAWVTPRTATPFIAISHRYWRLAIRRATTSNERVGVGTVMFMDNPSATVGATVGGSPFSPDINYAGRPPANAFDADPATMWMENSSGPYAPAATIGYDFGVGVVKTVVAVGITTTPETSYAVACAPYDFDVQYSDDNATWTTYWTVGSTAFTGVSQTMVFTHPSYVAGNLFLPAGGTTGQVLAKVSSLDGDAAWQTPSGGGGTTIGAKKYWRLMRMNAASTALAIAEIAAHATTGGANVAVTTATAFDSYDGTTLPANAIDTNVSTFWEGATNDMRQFFQIYFATATVVAEIVLTARNDGGHPGCPSVFELLCSDDGVTFKSVGVFVTSTAYTSGSSQTFTIPLSF